MKKLILFLVCITVLLLLTILFLGNKEVARKKILITAKIDKQDQIKVLNKWNDGPYIFSQKDQINAYYLCKGQVFKKTLMKESTPLKLSYCNTSVTLYELNYQEDNILEYNGDYKIAALSDIHGQYDLVKELLRNNKIINEKGDWAFGNGHLVITGDVFDRGSHVTEVLWLLYKLEQQATEKGGKLHLLLGNHEVMILNGDLRYLHQKYQDVSTKLGFIYDELYSKNSVLGIWLRSKPVLVKINNTLFMHGGFHSTLAEEELTLSFINRIFKKNLVKNELPQPREGWGKYLHGKNGPIWYRGYFEEKNKCLKKGIDSLLEYYGVDHIIVGHTSQKQIETRHCGRVIAIDASMKNGEYGELLFIKGDDMWRGTLTGEKLSLKDDKLLN